MTSVYVDLEAVSGAPGAAVAGGPPAEPGIGVAAARSLGFLGEAGHDVTLVVAGEAVQRGLAGWPVIAAGDLPVRPSSRAWYVTTNVGRCLGRSALLRTILIGSARTGAIHRCDSNARDLQAAVLEILATEAMS